MPQYLAPQKDYEFLLTEYLNLAQYADIFKFSAAAELVVPIVEAGAKFCEQELFPLHAVGDRQGCKLKDGVVNLPDGFVAAYKKYVEGGWSSITAEEEFGGQGLPEVLNMPMTEMVCSANLGFGLLPGLSHGAYHAISLHASDALKKIYLPKIASGEWSGVMCLTEPPAGTDLGLITTYATEDGADKYKIFGTKIFISCGEQDATENIIHLVLARLPNAPKGVKGISLFLVPKIIPETGERNALICSGLEEKMGLHASPTCVMNYDGATGWLIGEPHKGLKAMFTMMNSARLYVGVQGLGITELAYQNACHYAQERLQGRSLRGAVRPEKSADPITVHADIRYKLLTMRALAQGGRALALEMALKIDLAKDHADADIAEQADDFVQLLTPITKAFLTDSGFEAANLAMQVLGGYGYIREYGMEQLARDVRITQIYEGTNGIQALDLVGRKLPFGFGKYLRSFFHPVQEFLQDEAPEMQEFIKPLRKQFENLQKASLWLGKQSLSNPEDVTAAAGEYTKLFSLVVLGWIWARQAKIALARPEEEFYKQKLETARFVMNRMLPQGYGLLAGLTAGSNSIMKANF